MLHSCATALGLQVYKIRRLCGTLLYHQTISSQVKYLSGQTKFCQTNLLYNETFIEFTIENSQLTVSAYILFLGERITKQRSYIPPP